MINKDVSYRGHIFGDWIYVTVTYIGEEYPEVSITRAAFGNGAIAEAKALLEAVQDLDLYLSDPEEYEKRFPRDKGTGN